MRQKLWEDPPKKVSPQRTFRYRQAVAGPVELYFSKADNRLFLRVPPTADDPSELNELDVLIAQITALAVTKKHWRMRITSARLDVYLAFPNLCQVRIDFIEETVQATVDRYLNAHCRRMPDSVPIPILAYSMVTRKRTQLSLGIEDAERSLLQAAGSSHTMMPD